MSKQHTAFIFNRPFELLDPEDEATTDLQNIMIHHPSDTASQLKTPK
jgi:hypothetical protein